MDTEAELPGKVVVITGASDGIGAAAARSLHASGATVVVVGHSAEKTYAVADELGVQRHLVDYRHLDEIRGLAADLIEQNPRIEALINNAGMIAAHRTLTGDGHETMFQVNHLGAFLLTTLLKERLVESSARVINTASAASAGAVLDIDDLESERRYGPLAVYSTTKLENIVFTRELARRWGPLGVTTAAVHPGLVRSRFGSGSTVGVKMLMASPLRLFMRSPSKGADTLTWLAAAPTEEWLSGGYYSDRRLLVVNPQVDDLELARELWDRSAAMVGTAP